MSALEPEQGEKAKALAPCPCGKVPERLKIFEIFADLGMVHGDCCDVWMIEYVIPRKADCDAQGLKAWNNAPRGTE